jgi:hypothetical protein
MGDSYKYQNKEVRVSAKNTTKEKGVNKLWCENIMWRESIICLLSGNESSKNVFYIEVRFDLLHITISFLDIT